jgi:hypothetical protein
MYNFLMSPKTGHKEKIYELLRKSDFFSPFTFSEWQLDKKYMLMREKLRERKYTVKDTGIPYRMINHWESKRLMPEGVNAKSGREESGWRMFSLVEMVWLKIIARLRNFGFSLKQIKNVKEHIIHWNKLGYYPSLEHAVAQALFSSKDMYLRIIPSGTSDLVSYERIEMEKILKKSGDMILISIKSILAEVGMDFPELQGIMKLSEEELELLERIRDESSTEVKAGLKKGKITEIETGRMEVAPFNRVSYSEELKKNEGYGRTIEQVEKGKVRSRQVFSRTRFDKK